MTQESEQQISSVKAKRETEVFGVVKRDGTVEPVVKKDGLFDNGLFLTGTISDPFIKALPGFEGELEQLVEEKNRLYSLRRLPQIPVQNVASPRRKFLGIF